jgi:hypothetical protein
MSLWTPGGEVPVDRNPEPQSAPPDDGISGRVGGPSLEDLSPEERAQAEQMIAEMAEVQRQILSTPAAQIVTNHIAGFYELAALHLAQEHPKFDEAQLAIDAMAAVVDAVGGRLGDNEQPLRDALNQLQMAYVQRKAEADGA